MEFIVSKAPVASHEAPSGGGVGANGNGGGNDGGGGGGGITHLSRASHYLNMSHPKNAKAPCSKENIIANERSHFIYRHPTSMRAKGGNTPNRSKMSKKQLKLAQAQLDKFTQISVHIYALFSAVEHGHLEKARTIIESTDVDINSINADGLSALDVAVLSNNRSMTKMLLQHGATESSQFTTDSIGTKLNALLKDAESRMQELSSTADGTCQPPLTSRPSISSIIIGNSGSSVTGCTGSDVEKQIGIWERRIKGLRRMLLGWDQARPPDAAASVTVCVINEDSIVVQILEPPDGAITTKFKVQWSARADFSNVVGECEKMDWSRFHGAMGAQCHIAGLTQGRRYFIRATCGNVKGWGPFQLSVPASVSPSSWRDVHNREDRYLGRQHALDSLFSALCLARSTDASELTLDLAAGQRRNPKKKTTIKQLFSVASKFQKNLRRGIHFASVVYCEDKILVTSEDILPVIEVDETYPSTLNSDYHWFMKVACTWDDVKSLRSDMERNLTSASDFRVKLLTAVGQMQSALGLTNLGQLYHRPLRDDHGTVVLSAIQAVKHPKALSSLNCRWLPLNKLQKKRHDTDTNTNTNTNTNIIISTNTAITNTSTNNSSGSGSGSGSGSNTNIGDILLASIPSQINYHQASMQRLERGLYLGYLKMQCSVDQIQLVVPAATPNVLPHCKIRDNCHISAEEWQAFRHNEAATSGSGGTSSHSDRHHAIMDFSTSTEMMVTEVQRLFLNDVAIAAHKLFAYMNVQTDEEARAHRLYEAEVIEHSNDVSFLVVCPAVELTCVAPGQLDAFCRRDDLISLNIQTFEMIHLRVYQAAIMQKYARLSCILESDTTLANHLHREAFSSSELQAAKDRLAKLQELSANLNAVWKGVRWLMDIIAFARDKGTTTTATATAAATAAAATHASSMPMGAILECAQIADSVGGRGPPPHLLQLPDDNVRFTPANLGRGSWPGPVATTVSDINLAVEHSKSDQNLGRNNNNLVTQKSTALDATTIATTTAAATITAATTTSSQQQHLLQVTAHGHNVSDLSLSKYSPQTDTNTTRSLYSTADFLVGSNTELSSVSSNITSSLSDDILRTSSATAGYGADVGVGATIKSDKLAAVHRKRVSCNIIGYSGQPAMTATATSTMMFGSNSLPHLAEKTSLTAASLASKSTTSKATSLLSSKVKGDRGSLNFIDGGGLYLRETLSALQTEMKVPADEMRAATSRPLSHSAPSHHASDEDDMATCSSLTLDQGPSGIIQVYTAYDTGLTSGTSLKLHVTMKTSAREVINLVVKQLNMAAMLKGKNGPIYATEMLDNFCLVAVIGARERCLRDDFKPLQLQNPWKKGRLYVRQKHELLAAIEHSNRKSQLI